MLGHLLASRLLKDISSSVKISCRILNEYANRFGIVSQSIRPVSSILSYNFGPWEQFRQMGGGPRTFPGGVSKWQWKRMHEKMAREKEKKLLQQDRQVYEARVRSQLRGQLLENNDKNVNNDNNGVVEQNSSFGPMTPKDQVIALANRFMKNGAEDLWNEDDGPLTTDSEPPLATVEGKGSENFTENNKGKYLLGREKRSSRGPVTDVSRKNGSILFTRSFSSLPRRGRGFDRVGGLSDNEEVGQQYSGSRKRRGPNRMGSFSDDEEVGQTYGGYRKGRRSDRIGRFSDDEVAGQRYSASGRSRGLDRVGKFNDDKEVDERDGRRNAAASKSLIEDEMELGNLIDEEMASGIRFDDDFLSSDGKPPRDSSEDDEMEFRRSKPSRMGEPMRSSLRSRSKRQFSRDFNKDDDKAGFMQAKPGRVGAPLSRYSGSRSKRQSLSDFDGEEKIELRRPKPSSLRSKRQSFRDYDEEDKRELGWSKPSRMGDSMLNNVPSRSKRQSFKDSLEEVEEMEFRQPKHEGNSLKFGSRFRDIEEAEDEEESDVKLFKKEQQKPSTLKTECLKADNFKEGKEEESYLSQSRFDQCNISPLSLQALSSAGYVQMTVVQEATLPIILQGKDVLAKAKTGTGKTVAFLLPAIEAVVKSPPADQDQMRPPILVLVVCPTRELACQAAAEANILLKYHSDIGAQVVIGGTRLHVEQQRLQTDPCQILVATPGRLLDHIENTPGVSNRLMGLKVLILDEADHLLDMGFRKDLEKIIDAVPRQRQSLLFSATIPQEVHQISQIALRRDHTFINTVGVGCQETHTKVLQTYLVTSHENHFHVLCGVLRKHILHEPDYKVLVFCTTGAVTRIVYEVLLGLNFNVREIHSRKSQVYRTRMSDEFRNSKGLILVTSDVSARGVDYPDVTLVVQVGIPSDREQYIHRLGRTGRKGKEGQGLLLLAPWEEYFLANIKDLPIKKALLPEMDLDLKSRVQHALANIDSTVKESAYQAWLGYYNSVKVIGRDKTRLVELANQFSCCMGLEEPPAMLKKTVAKMGLRHIPGLRIKR